MDYTSCLEKQQKIKDFFASCRDEEEKYKKIIELGRRATPFDPGHKDKENIVQGCQSVMYLRSYLKDGRVYFESESDALISAGLAVLLIEVYTGEPPETILKCPPAYIEELGIHQSLTPNRANGLYQIHLRMKQDALKFLSQK